MRTDRAFAMMKWFAKPAPQNVQNALELAHDAARFERDAALDRVRLARANKAAPGDQAAAYHNYTLKNAKFSGIGKAVGAVQVGSAINMISLSGPIN
jgi:hypothetical protein